MYVHYLLDSSAADDPNNPTFIIPPTYFAYFKINSATIPLSYFPTGPQNNTIALKENAGVTRFVTVPPGTYNPITFPIALQAALGGTYIVTFDETKRNIKITNANLSFSIMDLAGGTTLLGPLGRRKYGGASAAGNTYQEGASDFSGTRSLFLISQDLYSKDVVVGNSQSVNALCLIDLAAPVGSSLYWKNNSDYVTIGKEMNTLRLQLIDSETLQPIDFRGRPFTLTMSALSDYDDKEYY